MAHESITILHVDMDAFYASVEQRDRPELRGRPVIVGGVEGRGVVCAASYEARPYGVHSAMPISTARRLCPGAVFLPVRMRDYAQISRQIRSIFFSFTPLVEPLSLDEAFLDVRGCQGLFGSAPEIAAQIKVRIKTETGLVASVGVAPNKFLAKLASDHGKPDGLVVLEPDRVTDFLAPLPVGRIWGVGAKGEKRLRDLGIATIGDLASLLEKVVLDHFGEAGRQMWLLAHGQDDRAVVPDREAKSVSTETTFAHDIAARPILRAWLLELVDQLAGRLRSAGIRTRTLELKLRSSEFQTRIRSVSLRHATDLTEELWQAAGALLERSLSLELLPIRLLGVGAVNLRRDRMVQRNFFGEEERDRQAALDRAVDTIRSQYGKRAIQRGSFLGRNARQGDAHLQSPELGAGSKPSSGA
jgi:DNA polymerase-4